MLQKYLRKYQETRLFCERKLNNAYDLTYLLTRYRKFVSKIFGRIEGITNFDLNTLKKFFSLLKSIFFTDNRKKGLLIL